MSWWGERAMKKKTAMPKKKLPGLYGVTPKKTEPDDKPLMPPAPKLTPARRRRLATRSI